MNYRTGQTVIKGTESSFLLKILAIYCRNIARIFCTKFLKESGNKSVKNAPKPLKTRLLHLLLNIRRGQFSDKNAYLRFLHEKCATINV